MSNFAPTEYTTRYAAEWLIWRNHVNNYRKSLSVTHLQDLLFYEYGFHLALWSSRLFNERIWVVEDGIRIKSVYEEYKDMESIIYDDSSPAMWNRFLDDGIANDNQRFSPKTSELNARLEDVYKIFRRYKDLKLHEMVHEELYLMKAVPDTYLKREAVRLHFGEYYIKTR